MENSRLTINKLLQKNVNNNVVTNLQFKSVSNENFQY